MRPFRIRMCDGRSCQDPPRPNRPIGRSAGEQPSRPDETLSSSGTKGVTPAALFLKIDAEFLTPCNRFFWAECVALDELCVLNDYADSRLRLSDSCGALRNGHFASFIWGKKSQLLGMT